MNNSSIFAAQFAAASLNSLVASFNHEVGNHGWSSARASFAKPVSLQDNTLIICK